MRPESTLRVGGPHIVAEEIDGEVIAINLDTGAYFSFRGVAAEIWRGLLGGEVAVQGIVAALGEGYAAGPGQIERGVLAFCLQLEEEGLIEATDSAPDGADRLTPDGADSAPPPASRPAFAVPVYEKYTDMEEFLLVDPIHEVDVSDWPAARPRQSR